jgi:hypothetical protein
VADEAKEARTDLMVAVFLTVAFLAVAALALLPMGRWRLLLTWGRGYLVLWGAILGLSTLLVFAMRALRINADDHFDAYLLSNGALTGLLVAAWAAWVALLVDGAAAGAPTWAAVLLYALGLVSSWNGFGIVTMFYQGSFYKRIGLPVSVLGFALFAAWPPAARATFGRLFGLFAP